jgi:V8-like Glu-specific endopeptidase
MEQTTVIKGSFFDDVLVEVSKEGMQTQPHRTIGLLEMFSEQREEHGTGTLISANLVLTSAHHVFIRNFTESNYAEKIRFYPAHRGQLKDPIEV